MRLLPFTELVAQANFVGSILEQIGNDEGGKCDRQCYFPSTEGTIAVDEYMGRWDVFSCRSLRIVTRGDRRRFA